MKQEELELFAREAAKGLKTEDGQIELNRPRDRLNRFEPQLVKKGQTRFTSMDDNARNRLDI